MKYSFPVLIISSILFFNRTLAQNVNHTVRNSTVNVFVDCNNCDVSFIKEKIQFVNFVRDRKVADIHVLSNSIATGGKGRLYTLIFIGLRKFRPEKDTLTYVTTAAESNNSKRSKLVKVLKLGILPFINKTPIADQLVISYKNKNSKKTNKKKSDPWDYWVFRTKLRSFFNGEKRTKFLNLNYSFTVSRITEEWKFQMSFRGNYNESKFIFDNGTILNVSRRLSSYNYAIKSLSKHWSFGGWIFLTSSTYSNLDFKISAAPGVEYNIFPYSDFNSKQLRIQYRIWSKYQNYTEETIYSKMSEVLFEQTISATLDLIQPWGSISTTASFSTHFHDFSKNSFNLSGSISLQLVEGLALNIDGGYSAVHDQFSLPKSSASLNDVLLQQRELASQYNYWGSVGVSYTFGSIYNNIVNPRFGN